MHGSDVLFNGTRRSRNFHTGTEGFQMHACRGVELVFAIFGCNFSLAFQRAKERSNPVRTQKLWMFVSTLRKTVFWVHELDLN